MNDIGTYLAEYNTILATGEDKNNYHLKRVTENSNEMQKLDSDVVILVRKGVRPEAYIALLKEVTSVLKSEFRANEKTLHNAAVRNDMKEFQEKWA